MTWRFTSSDGINIESHAKPDIIAVWEFKQFLLRLNEKALTRFWSRVNKNGPTPEYNPILGPCWAWCGSFLPEGYGQFFHRSQYAAHRLSYQLEFGSIQSGLHLDHLCRNRGCVNPQHLEPVTPKENVLRGVGITAQNAKKTHCSKGHPLSGKNIKIYGNSRHCITCRRIRDKEYKHRKATHEQIQDQ